MIRRRSALGLTRAVVVFLLGQWVVSPQAPAGAGAPVRSVAAAGAGLAAWPIEVDRMLHEGRLDLGRVQRDSMFPGRTHERLDQRHDGLPVFGGQLARQTDGRATISVFGRIWEGIDVDVTPSLGPQEARLAAARREGADAVTIGTATLGILPRASGDYVLAYRLRVHTRADILVSYVNARTGTIERRESRLVSQTTGTVGRGTGVLGDDKKVSVRPAGGGFEAVDLLRPTRISTLDFAGNLFRLGDFLVTGETFDADVGRDPDNVWTDGAVVDAQVYQGLVHDYYFKRFGRHSLDDGGLPIRGIVHPLLREAADAFDEPTRSSFINNALYLGDGYMLYGDGDGLVFDYLSGALDVVAHELTHGVTDYTSQLVYLDEPGALNEAFSDIMAASVEFFYQPPGNGPGRSDWLIAEDVTRFGRGFLRSMSNPAQLNHPDHYRLLQLIGTGVDNGGVHINSSIANHVYYLAVNGGRNRFSGMVVDGVGLERIERMEQIFYRAFVYFLSPTADFADARRATLNAAIELYGAGSIEFEQLALAWAAVGLN